MFEDDEETLLCGIKKKTGQISKHTHTQTPLINSHLASTIYVIKTKFFVKEKKQILKIRKQL